MYLFTGICAAQATHTSFSTLYIYLKQATRALVDPHSVTFLKTFLQGQWISWTVSSTSQVIGLNKQKC